MGPFTSFLAVSLLNKSNFPAIYSCSQKKKNHLVLFKAIYFSRSCPSASTCTVPQGDSPESVHVNRADRRRGFVCAHLTAEIKSSDVFNRNNNKFGLQRTDQPRSGQGQPCASPRRASLHRTGAALPELPLQEQEEGGSSAREPLSD